MREQSEQKRRDGENYLLIALVLLGIIALCFGVGKTYSLITEATNVVVNTFYGESASEEPGDSGETEEPETDGTETDEPDTEEQDISEPESGDTGITEEEETETSVPGTSETDTGEGAKTGDDSDILTWVIIAAVVFVVIVIISVKLLYDRKVKFKRAKH